MGHFLTRGLLSFLFAVFALAPAWSDELYAGMYHGLVAHGVRRYTTPNGANMTAIGPEARQVEHILLAPDGTLYMADGHVNAIWHYDPATGALIRTFATGMPNGPDLDSPRGMAFGPEGSLYVASFWNSRILRYHPETGQMLGIFFQGGVFEKPMGLTVRHGTLYTANYHGGVMRFDLATGTRLPNAATDAFMADTVLFEPGGAMLVSDYFNNRILRYGSPTATTGSVFISEAGGGLSGPRGMAFDTAGNLYVSSFWNNKIQRFNAASGALLGTFMSGDGFFKPTGLATSSAVSVRGTVTLANVDASAAPQPITFTFRPASGSAFSRTAMIGPNGAFAFTAIPAGNYEVHIKGTRYLAANVNLNTTTGSVSNLTATLRPGDANDDNSADVLDLDILLQAFDSTPQAPHWNPNADFNGDNGVDVLDLDLLIQIFDTLGDA